MKVKIKKVREIKLVSEIEACEDDRRYVCLKRVKETEGNRRLQVRKIEACKRY